MPIDVTCTACSKRFRLKDELAGKRFKCKGCGEILTAGSTGHGSSTKKKTPKKRPASQSTAPAGKKKKRRVKDLDPIPDPFADDYDKEDEEAATDSFASNDFGDAYEDDFGDSYGDDYGEDYAAPAPKKRKKKKSGKPKSLIKSKKKKRSSGGGLPPVTFNANQLNIALVAIGGVLLFLGFRELRLAAGSSATPQEITLAEIYENGPGDDVYLTVSGVFPASDGYVATEGPGGRMTEIWYACVPENGVAQPNFIVYSTDASTEAAVDSLMRNTTKTGMLINSVKGLDSETKSLLKQGIPGVNVDSCLVFHEGRTPAGFLKYGGFLLGGLVLMLAGLFWIFFVHE